MHKTFLILFALTFEYYSSEFCLAQNINNGDSIIVPLTIDDNKLDINFRYCAPGDMPLTAPWNTNSETQASFKSNGFYILETELTIHQLSVILGEKALEDPLKILENYHQQLPDGGYDFFITAYQNRSPDVPAIFLKLADLVKLCHTLDITSNAQNLPANTIEGRTFRLLAVPEWQKAALGNLYSKLPNTTPLFYNYPSPDNLDKGIKRRFETAREDAGKSELFTGTIDSYYKSLNVQFRPNMRRLANEALRMFFAIAILPGSKPKDLARPISYPVQIKYSTPNSIGIYDLLSGLPEWTISAVSEDLAAANWKKLKDLYIDNAPNASLDLLDFSLTLSGGSFIRPLTSFTNDNFDWMTTTIWGGPRMDEGKLKEFNLPSFDSATIDEHAGVRLGLFRTIQPDWFVIIRDKFREPGSTVNEINEKYSETLHTLQEVGTETNTKLIGPVLEYYHAISNYQAGETNSSVDMLANTAFPEVENKSNITKDDIKKFDFSDFDVDAALNNDNLEIGNSTEETETTTTSAYKNTTPAGENALFVETLRELTKLDSELLK